jgi:hypothetical protein
MDERIVEINGKRVRLKGVAETFRYVHLMLGGRPEPPGIGNAPLEALREVGHHIRAATEPQYAQVLSEMFGLYCAMACAVADRVGCFQLCRPISYIAG